MERPGLIEIEPKSDRNNQAGNFDKIICVTRLIADHRNNNRQLLWQAPGKGLEHLENSRNTRLPPVRGIWRKLG